MCLFTEQHGLLTGFNRKVLVRLTEQGTLLRWGPDDAPPSPSEGGGSSGSGKATILLVATAQALYLYGVSTGGGPLRTIAKVECCHRPTVQPPATAPPMPLVATVAFAPPSAAPDC